MNKSICGIWSNKTGDIYLAVADEDSIESSRNVVVEPFKPFAWITSEADVSNFECNVEHLDGVDFAPLNKLVYFNNSQDLDLFFKKRNKSLPTEKISSIENQYLLANSKRMFCELSFKSLRRIQLDIETASEGGFPKASRLNDRILAIGISGWGGSKIIELEEYSDEAEKKLLEELNKEIQSRDPDVIEGHNIFNFDLPYINERAKRFGVSLDWGRFSAPVKFRISRIKIAERIYTYTRCDIPGRTVIDTMILVQLFDVSVRELPSYSLKSVAIHFGISNVDERTYILGGEIQNIFKSDRERFRSYLLDDLRETAGISDLLLPAYFAQVKNFPLTLQECELRGSGVKVENLFLEKYYEHKKALPLPQSSGYFEGALSESYALGVFKNVLHYDVASLYPSLMLVIGKCPANDYLKIFLQELKVLRKYRLEYKQKAREAESEELRNEYDARQKSFKILINSFYGYLGLDTAVFGDVNLAREITKTGRELLVKLMDAFRAEGCEILEADTDGIYLTSEKYFKTPDVLLEKVLHALPDGVDLDFDGSFDAMLCYKAKNYALMNGTEIKFKGSSFRNRSSEKFLRDLTELLVSCCLKSDMKPLESTLVQLRKKIEDGEIDVMELAKGEFLGKAPDLYERELQTGGKRRASMEAALKMKPRPRMGEKVLFYISKPIGKKTPDWSRAEPVSAFDKKTKPYDNAFYLKKIDDWIERYSDLLNGVKLEPEAPVQAELFDLF